MGLYMYRICHYSMWHCLFGFIPQHLSCLISSVIFSFHADGEESDLPTVGKILQFLTGSATVPLFGYESHICPRLILTDESAESFPVVSTCALTLSVPVNYPDYDTLRSKFNLALEFGMDHFGKL